MRSMGCLAICPERTTCVSIPISDIWVYSNPITKLYFITTQQLRIQVKQKWQYSILGRFANKNFCFIGQMRKNFA